MKSVGIRQAGWLAVTILILVGGGNAIASQKTLTIMTHDSFNVSKDVIQQFEQEHDVQVRILKAGDAGAALNKAIISKNNPLADLFFGIDNTFLSRGLKADLFMPYRSPMLDQVHPFLESDPQHRVTPIDFGDVCLNYDRAWFETHNIAPPTTLEDLIKPAYKDLTVVENPATSSPGLAFLLATIGHFGPEHYLEYWRALKANGVLVTNGWEEAYWGYFSAASKGTRPLVVSYASSPPAEVHYAEKKPLKAPTAAVVGAGTTFRQVEYVGILKGTAHPELAQAMLDFMLGLDFQQDIPLQMFVFPSNRLAQLPEVFTRHAKIAQAPIGIAAAKIDASRDRWIKAWREVVLR